MKLYRTDANSDKLYSYVHNFWINWARKSRLVRFGQVWNFLQNLTNRYLLAQFVQTYHCWYQFCMISCNFIYRLHSITTSKRIEQEIPGWSGLVRFWIFYKSWPTGTFLFRSCDGTKLINKIMRNYTEVIPNSDKLCSYVHNF